MGILRKLFGSSKLDGMAMARSTDKTEYGQIALLAQFFQDRPTHPAAEQQLWNRALSRSYSDSLKLFQQQGWLVATANGYVMTPTAQPMVAAYQERLASEKAEVLPKVRKALAARDTSDALEIRRDYEARQPLGKADWTGPEPQLSHSALTRRILFLNHWLLEGLSDQTSAWLKQYAAEQHLWGAYERLSPGEVPAFVQQELAKESMDGVEAAYWRAYQLALYVENHETWQRCKGGDHVRRLEIAGPNDEFTCDYCRQFIGRQFLVARAPELPHRNCASSRGCRCRYEPVLESYDAAG